jgi:hypothetical protein
MSIEPAQCIPYSHVIVARLRLSRPKMSDQIVNGPPFRKFSPIKQTEAHQKYTSSMPRNVAQLLTQRTNYKAHSIPSCQEQLQLVKNATFFVPK